MEYIKKVNDDGNVMLIANRVAEAYLDMKDINELIRETDDDRIKAVMISKVSRIKQKGILKKEDSFELYEMVRVQENGYTLLDEMPIEQYLQMSDYSDEKINFIIARYNEILKVNENLPHTINFEILSPEFEDVFNKEQIARITAQSGTQDKIVKACNSPLKLKILKEICKDDNEAWLLQINNILENITNYEELLKELESNGDIEKIDITQLVEVLSDTSNYFDVHTVDEVNNFENIRKNTCLELLEGRTPENASGEILKLDPLSRQKFALLQLYFGVDLREAEKLVGKYGKDILELWQKDKNNVSLETLLLMKTIYEAEDLEDLDLFKEQFASDEYEIPPAKSISQIENECIKTFSQIYNDSLFRVDGKDCSDEIVIDGSRPFNMIVRVEGAYGDFKEPKDFREYFDKPDITYHGCCKSLISNNMVATANPKDGGPIFGYNDLEYLLMAPWDIGSSSANVSLSISSYDYGDRVQYRSTKNMINQTRDAHNEVVSDRLVYNKEENKLEKERPQYVIWIKEKSNETDIERQMNKKWRMTKKAAEQLNIPIVIIDREAILEKEAKKIEDTKMIFSGEKENTENLTDKQLLEKMIVEFENNRIGNYFTCKDKIGIRGNKYFLAQDRINLFSFIESEMTKMQESDPERYKACLEALIEITQGEHDKGFSEEDMYSKFYSEKLAYYTKLRENIAPDNSGKRDDMEENKDLKETVIIDSFRIASKKSKRQLESAAREIIGLEKGQEDREKSEEEQTH